MLLSQPFGLEPPRAHFFLSEKLLLMEPPELPVDKVTQRTPLLDESLCFLFLIPKMLPPPLSHSE